VFIFPILGSKEILMALMQLFRDSNFLGGSITKTDSDNNLPNDGFNDAVSSVIVTSGTFTLYQDVNFRGFSFTVCKTGGPASDGRYPNPQSLAGRNDAISSLQKNSDDPL
jgi:Beta/Gamma crystallin